MVSDILKQEGRQVDIKSVHSMVGVGCVFEVMAEGHSFAAAHQLFDENGAIEPLHGHNFTVQVTAKSTELGRGNIAVDFNVLKKHLEALLETWDHQELNKLPAFQGESPSVERMAVVIYDELKVKVPELSKVRVCETEKYCVTYSR